YTAELNGKKCNIYKSMDSFIAVKLENGNFTLKLAFLPQGFIFSLILSVIGFIILLIYQKNSLKLSNCKKLTSFCLSFSKYMFTFLMVGICFTGLILWVI
ncbi:MAG: YfhO family protein, partial [Oscillospiraceae bacterium]|nr:YfhO family protein [Oscillospiraceae bacterium]